MTGDEEVLVNIDGVKVEFTDGKETGTAQDIIEVSVDGKKKFAMMGFDLRPTWVKDLMAAISDAKNDNNKEVNEDD